VAPSTTAASLMRGNSFSSGAGAGGGPSMSAVGGSVLKSAGPVIGAGRTLVREGSFASAAGAGGLKREPLVPAQATQSPTGRPRAASIAAGAAEVGAGAGGRSGSIYGTTSVASAVARSAAQSGSVYKGSTLSGDTGSVAAGSVLSLSALRTSQAAAPTSALAKPVSFSASAGAGGGAAPHSPARVGRALWRDGTSKASGVSWSSTVKDNSAGSPGGRRR